MIFFIRSESILEKLKKDLDVFQLKIDSFRMIMVEIDSHSETGDHYNRQLYKFGIKNSFESFIQGRL